VGNYPLEDTTYPATILLSGNSSTTFDTSTGLVLVSTDNAVGMRLPELLPVPDTGTQLSYARLLGMRQRAVPGTGAPVPGWLRQGTVLEFTGIDQQLYPLDARATFTYTDVGPDWARVHAARTSGYGVASVTGESWAISGGAGPFWYDPVALGGMARGDVLDQDPLLGMVTRVAGTGAWALGEYVQILTSGPGTEMLFTYDRATGVPLGYSLAQGGATFAVTLDAMP
jgi:hypothetical protein